MLYQISMEPEQAAAFADWIDTSPGMATILLAKDVDTLVVGQGDSRARILASGTLIEED